ncbi:TetR/AcrR family transcriptional regulator [Streptomyces sp. ISL-10]|uniref:TetR/AcrR family transcriptional regulator n=1 Tax=Streptomyces sp. ISL-10 TaxID=2819172 RepID=UPI001BE9693E|nr:TetR/AcrR family transcriptional regulator [Streptomyces sp. ISL-10]MBT2365278.1 TetR/AcrR family transcriptional regulator [Streptomyces sp. ISL-10]
MPAARESLLDAALAALGELPWSGVRMTDVAGAAGVSRQTLYNEFGSKDGLARALMRRETDRYLRGVERLMAQRTEPAERLVSLAEWTVGEARTRPLLRALLTGCWSERLPAPRPVRRGAGRSVVPAQRRADAPLPAPAELLAAVRDRSRNAVRQARRSREGRTTEDPADLPQRCELAVRLALSCVVAPVGEGLAQLVRAALDGLGAAVIAKSPRAADR